MRHGFIVFGLCVLGLFVFSTAYASSTLRVGSAVLTVGDSAARVQELLGKPSHKSHSGNSHSSKKKGSKRKATASDSANKGEQWQYRRGDTTTTVTIVDGKVANIEDQRS